MKIGDRVFVRGYIDEIRKDTVIIRNAGGYFGTIPSEVITGELPSAQPSSSCAHENDYISRQAAIDLVKDVCDAIMSCCGSHYDEETDDEVYDDIREIDAILKCNKEIRIALKNMPSAEPERKTGKWNFIGDNMFECTSCGVVYTTSQLNGLRNYDTDPYAPKFCPNCGADMRGEQND